MAFSQPFCDLCGLPVRRRGFASSLSDKTLHFCCQGCRQVFHMLAEMEGSRDPGAFRESGLFKRCQELGLVPRSEADSGKESQGEQGTPETAARAEARHLSVSLKIKGMWCPACAWVIEEALRKKPGLLKVECSFSLDRLRCDYDPVLVTPSAIAGVAASFGCQAFPPDESIPFGERRKEIVRLAVSAFLSLNVMMISFGVYAGFVTDLSPDAIRKLSWPIFIMATFVLLYGGRAIYRSALKGIVSSGFGMETLITLGVFTAYLYSTYRFLSGSIHLYYDTACMLIVLVLLGKFLESGAKARIQQDLDHLFSIRPSKVRILGSDHESGKYVSIEHLKKGDRFEVGEGEVVPADGSILEGNAAVDESSLTGEARPVAKGPGDFLPSGVRVVQGVVKARAEKIGDDSTLGQMLAIMEKALSDGAPFEGRIDRILKWFVPLVLAAAGATGVFCLGIGLPMEEAVIRSMTVMVISCPCTLGISIPLTRLAGISMAGKRGILVRNFSSFEKALDLDTFVFDKTGTVTEGRWRLLDIVTTGLVPRREVLAGALAVEESSPHYIATELKRRAAEASVPLPSASDVVVFANGVRGEVQGHEVRIGSREFMKEALERFEGMKGPTPIEPGSQKSLVYMSTDGKLCAVFVFGDEIKTGSPETIQKLKEWGYKLFLISGDGNEATRAVAERTALEEAHGGKLPWDKAAFIERLQAKKCRVAMVGDGLNDARALTQADLGIAVHSGGSLTQEASDLTLMRGDPRSIVDFLILAKRVRGKIRQNLVFSGLYNLIAIPVAMSGLLSPLIAVGAMLLSSLSVIGNTLLLIKSED